MTTSRLFVSHSSRSKRDRGRLREICNRLTQLNYHTLVDQSGDIPVGSDWDLYLSEWMAECHAAIILFSQHTLHSDWVQKEAAILCWRARIDPTFRLIGILLDGVTPDQIDENALYRVLRVTDFQLQRACASADDVVQTVQAALGGPQTQYTTPFDDLERCIRDIVEQFAEPPALKDAWDRLPAANKPATPPDFRFASAFARYVLRDPQQALTHLHKLFESLVHVLDRSAAEQLRTLVVGVWVEAEAASRLADAMGKVVAINGARVPRFSGRAYCERAWPYPRVYQIVPINTLDWGWTEIDRAIQARFEDPSDPFDDPSQNIRDYSGHLVILIASRNRQQPPDSDILNKLRTTYPKAIVLYWPGTVFPDNLPTLISPLRPALDLGQEQSQYEVFNQIDDLIAARARG